MNEPKRLKSESGAVYTEYAVSLSLLAAVFVAAGVGLRQFAEVRAERSVATTTNTLPCQALGVSETSEQCF